MKVPLLCYCVFDLFLDCLPLEFQFSKIRNITNAVILQNVQVQLMIWMKFQTTLLLMHLAFQI
jgi:hypothetical protein